MAIVLGNIIQQLWMLLFESPRSGFAYNSQRRRALRRLATLLKEPPPSQDDLYAIWETFLYSDAVPDSIRKKDRGTWHFYHANAANAFGLALASLASYLFAAHLLAIPVKAHSLWFLLASVALAVLARLFWIKATQTRYLVETLEEYWLNTLYRASKGSSEPSSNPTSTPPTKRLVHIDGVLGIREAADVPPSRQGSSE